MDELVKGLTLYLDTVYKLDNPVPNTGTILIRYTGFDIKNVTWVFNAA